MRKILNEIFTRQFTIFDLLIIGIGTQLLVTGHWALMLGVIVTGMIVGIIIEHELGLRIPRQK